MLTLIRSCEGLNRFVEELSFFLSPEIFPATAGGMEATSLPWPCRRSSGPADESDIAHGLEARGKYPRNRRISMNICPGTDRSETLGQNIFEKNILIKT
jgi:hypothetical protein